MVASCIYPGISFRSWALHRGSREHCRGCVSSSCLPGLSLVCGALAPHGAFCARWKRKEEWIGSAQDAGSTRQVATVRASWPGQLTSPNPGSRSLPTWSGHPPGIPRWEKHSWPLPRTPQFDEPQELWSQMVLSESLPWPLSSSVTLGK